MFNQAFDQNIPAHGFTKHGEKKPDTETSTTKYICTVFIDCKKAFDLIDNTILINKPFVKLEIESFCHHYIEI